MTPPLFPLWYFETRSILGHWTPNTSQIQPATITRKGVDCLNTQGGFAPRIRNLVQVPDAMRDTCQTLDTLQSALARDGLITTEVAA